MPAVDGKQPATCDGDGCWYAKVGERVGRDVRDGGVGRELEHHDDILLHLILKHQWALGKETLVRQTEKERGTGRKRKREKGRARTGRSGQRGGAGEWRRRERERQNRWDRGREGKRYISGSTGSEQVHTLRVALGQGEEVEALAGRGFRTDRFGLKWMALMWRH